MKYTFLQLAKDVIIAEKKPLTQNQIWDKAVDLKIAEKIGSTGKTPWQTIGARLYVDIKENPNSDFIQVSSRPALFYLKELDPKAIPKAPLKAQQEPKNRYPFNERDLHPLLSTFVFSSPHFNCYTKTIFHEKSDKNPKGLNKWLHPDLVGIHFPFGDFHYDTISLLEALKENKCKLFSFEMKIEITMSTLKEYYFQAVSNSSWAHEGYLVTLKLDDEPSLIDEIRRLNNSFGIGLIKLDPINIEQSEIVFSAKTKDFLDWETIDTLTKLNFDFQNFIKDFIEDKNIKKVKSEYDKVLATNTEEFNDYVKQKQIM